MDFEDIMILQKRPMRYNKTIAIIVLCVLAIFLRSYGLDSHIGPDETLEVDRALDALKGTFYWSRIIKGGLYILLIPLYFILNFFSHSYETFLIAGRLIQVILGTCIIYFIYKILEMLYGSSWAVLFTLPPIINVHLIENAHHVNVQNLMFLFLIIHLYIIIKYFKEKKDNRLLGLSLIPLFAGAACQISAFILIIPYGILVAIYSKKINKERKRDIGTHILRWMAISIFIYILLTPGILIYLPRTLGFVTGLLGITDAVLSRADMASSYVAVSDLNFWTSYAERIINFYGKGYFILVSISSIFIIWKKKWILFYPLGIFLLYYLVFVNAAQTVFSVRYIIPGLIMGFIVMPFAVVECSHRMNHYTKKIQYGTIGILVAVILVFLLRSSFYTWDFVRQFGLPDTRTRLAEWLEEHTSENTIILLEDSVVYPKIDTRPVELIEHWNAYQPLDSVKADYIVLNKSEYDILYKKRMKTRYQQFYLEVINSPLWTAVHHERRIGGKTTGHEFIVYHTNR